MKIELIPKGRKNKINRQSLMNKAKIFDEKTFQKEMAILKQNHIILFNDGYYRPDTKKEYEDFMNKCNLKRDEMYELIVLAKKEMEGIIDL